MKRFRFTLLAICLVLLFLGWNDISLFLRNRAPETIAVTALEQNGAPREWLHVTGGTLDLLEAISTSGSIELEALLIPLKSDPQAGDFRVLVETREPGLIKLFRTYHFKLDSEEAQERYLDEHRSEFFPRQDVSGTLVTGLIATGNRDKLMTLAKDVGMQVTDDVIFIAEGKEPARIRGFIFFALALAGLVKFAAMGKRNSPPQGEA
ncbi:hypothetical protein DSOUD_3046 [Desulfuromonas soudanensis]|uniref:Uncharacterized protein n=1 Tax=Desulfuromonas soudanensis TaxID=1603606 RepID=A0A0M4D8R5_9BACT|nr:hypothetical protein [Desulfuromonas soudanensis]ALC17772.1 hypothetical protein DSOUD_3046 [Desulfuromonas soudanensis]